MAGLTALSDELILEVISHLYHSYSLPPLCQLALVSRRLHGLTMGVLLQEIRLDSSSKGYFKFLQSVRANATLGPQVHRLDLNWCDTNVRSSPQDLLCYLPRLRYLSIDVWLRSKLNPSRFLGPTASTCFYELKITLEKPDSNDIPNLLLLDRITALEITIPFTFQMPQIERSRAPRTAPLQSFRTMHDTLISHRDLQNLLTYPKSLIDISISIPGRCDPFSASMMEYNMFDTLSPYSIQQKLSVCAATLSSLEIRNAKQSFPQGHDGTCLSLARFTSLKKATIASNLLFDTLIPPSDLYTLLPLSLSYFTITFDMEREIPTDNTWLQRLAESKAAHLPHLANIDVLRNTFEECGTTAANTDFDFEFDVSDTQERMGYPEEFKQAFRDAEIKLNGIDLRVPEMHPLMARYDHELRMKFMECRSWDKAFEELGPPPPLPPPSTSIADDRETPRHLKEAI